MKAVLFFLFLFLNINVFAQSILGTWKTIDDETGLPKSYIKIYKNSQGEIEGKIVKILVKDKLNARCTNCKGSKKDQPYLGFILLENLESNGKVTNPDTGKVYDCNVELVGKDRLKVRGYMGTPILGRTQIWERVK